MATATGEIIEQTAAEEIGSYATNRPADRELILPHVIDRYYASDGYPLHLRRWSPADDMPLAHVVAMHGIQSHSGWYAYSASRMCQAGFDVHFLDRRGAGLNAEERGHTPHPDRLINDVCQYLRHLRFEQRVGKQPLPVILLSVSWAGRMATTIAARQPELVDALGLLYPGIHSRVRPSPVQLFKLNMALMKGYRRHAVPIPLTDPALFTQDVFWQDFIREDSLALHKASLSFLSASRQLDQIAQTEGSDAICPVLMMLAGQDRIIDNNKVKAFLHQMQSKDKWLIEYPSASHTLEFEVDRDVFIDDLLHWLSHAARVAQPSL